MDFLTIEWQENFFLCFYSPPPFSSFFINRVSNFHSTCAIGSFPSKKWCCVWGELEIAQVNFFEIVEGWSFCGQIKFLRRPFLVLNNSTNFCLLLMLRRDGSSSSMLESSNSHLTAARVTPFKASSTPETWESFQLNSKVIGWWKPSKSLVKFKYCIWESRDAQKRLSGGKDILTKNTKLIESHHWSLTLKLDFVTKLFPSDPSFGPRKVSSSWNMYHI